MSRHLEESRPRRLAFAVLFWLLRCLLWPAYRFSLNVVAHLLYLLLPVVSLVLYCWRGRAKMPTDLEESEPG